MEERERSLFRKFAHHMGVHLFRRLKRGFLPQACLKLSRLRDSGLAGDTVGQVPLIGLPIQGRQRPIQIVVERARGLWARFRIAHDLPHSTLGGDARERGTDVILPCPGGIRAAGKFLHRAGLLLLSTTKWRVPRDLIAPAPLEGADRPPVVGEGCRGAILPRPLRKHPVCHPRVPYLFNSQEGTVPCSGTKAGIHGTKYYDLFGFPHTRE